MNEISKLAEALKPVLTNEREVAAFFLGAQSIIEAMKKYDGEAYDSMVEKFRLVATELTRSTPLQ